MTFFSSNSGPAGGGSLKKSPATNSHRSNSGVEAYAVRAIFHDVRHLEQHTPQMRVRAQDRAQQAAFTAPDVGHAVHRGEVVGGEDGGVLPAATRAEACRAHPRRLGVLGVVVEQRHPVDVFERGLAPVRTLCNASPQDRHTHRSPIMIANARCDWGTSDRKHSARGVSAKASLSPSLKTPTPASARSTRYSASASASTRAARSSAVPGPSAARRSATPSWAAMCTALGHPRTRDHAHHRCSIGSVMPGV